MSKNFFSFSPSLGIAMGTVLFLVAIGSAYFLAYLPANQKTLEDKQFRCLQNAERNIQDKMDNSLALLRNLVQNYEKPAAGQSKEDIIEYIRNYPSKDFKLSIMVQPRAQNARTDTAITFNQDSLYIGIKAKDARFDMSFTFKQFIDPLLPRDIFDKYIIFRGKKVIYETFPSGITEVADSLIINNGATARGTVKDILLSGTTYKFFPQQFNLETTSSITIAGLLAKDHYVELKNKLPEQIVVLLLLVAIAGIIALPWIKLYQMGSKDRMTASDGLFSLAVPMLLMSIMFFAFFSCNIAFRLGPKATGDRNRDLANRIKSNFNQELNDTYAALTRAAAVYRAHPVTAGDTAVRGALRKATSGVMVNQVYQLNEQGTEIRNWTPGIKSAPPGNYANRQYFMRLKNRNAFYLHHDLQKRFYIEQVTSWTTASFTTVMSIPGPGQQAPYTAISFNVKCLNDAVLTPGFIYSIIDAGGKVLYHSIAAKQLNENLFEEFADHETLKGAVEAHSDTLFSTKYSGKQYHVYVSPFADLPYHLLIMEDKSYDGALEINNFAFSFSMLFAFFMLLAAELLLVFMVSVKKRAYKKHYFDLSWIGPNQKFHRPYIVALCGNSGTILLLVGWMAFMKASPFLECLFILLTASCISFLFLNLLYMQVYKKEENEEEANLKKNGVFILAGILLLFNIAAMVLTGIKTLLLFELSLAALLLAVWYLWEWLPAKNKEILPETENFSRSFSLMTFTRMIITSGLPVLLFYISIANYGIKLVTRYRHTQLVKSMLEHNPPDTAMLKRSNLYLDHAWIQSAAIISRLPGLPVTPGEENAHALFRSLTISNDSVLPGINALDHAPGDQSWTYSSLFMQGRGLTYYRLDDHHFLRLASDRLSYQLPPLTFDAYWYKSWSYWLLFALILAGFWLLLHEVLRRLFALNLPSTQYWQELDRLILVNSKLNSLVFLIGAPGSGKLKALTDLIKKKDIRGMGDTMIILDQKDAGVNGYIADMILIPNNADAAAVPNDWMAMKTEALLPKYKLVIVNHFEYDIKNPVSNRLKLDFLEELLEKNSGKVMIISTVHPINFLDSLNQQGADTAEGTDRSPEHDLERWHVLLGHFKIVFQKLTSTVSRLTPKVPSWQKTLNEETGSGHFLNSMYNPMLTRLKEGDIKEKIDGEALTLKLGMTSHYFYMYIWQALTKEEKFLLYDLAEDGLVNPYDDYNLILLISKGLVISGEGPLRIFNHGFREFILTAIGNTEAIQIQKRIKDNGNWNKLKIPLVLLIMALLVFLFTSQKEVYTNLLKYITIVTAGVPIILKLFSGLGTSDSKTT